MVFDVYGLASLFLPRCLCSGILLCLIQACPHLVGCFASRVIQALVLVFILSKSG